MSKKPLVTVTDFTGEHKTPIYHATELESKKVIGKTHIIQDCYIGDVDYSNGVALPILSDTDFGAIGVCLIAPTGERTRIGNTPADNDRLANYSLLANGDYLGNYDPKGVILTNDTALACRIVELDKGVILASDDDLPLLAERLKDFNTPCKWASNTTTAPQWLNDCGIECVSLDGYLTAYKVKAAFSKKAYDADKLAQDKADLENAIDLLMELDNKELALIISTVAKEHGISQKALSGFVTEKRNGNLIIDTAPHNEPQDGKAIFDEIYKLIDDHILIDEPYKVAFSLWIMFTYLIDIAEFAPIAWITSPEKECGKTTLLGLFSKLVYRPFPVSNPTQAIIYRVIDRYNPCLLVDESDTSVKEKYELLGIINSGYSRHAPNIPRINTDNGNSIEVFNVFGAKVFAGIGEMIGTFASRSIRFEMKRKSQDIELKSLNHKTLPHAKTELLKQKIKRWCDDNRQAVKATDIPLLKIRDRDFDNWYILLQIASVLGIYDRAVKTCLDMCGIEKELSLGEMLLSDIRQHWVGEISMNTTALLDKLIGDDELIWSSYSNGQPISKYKFAQLLKSFGIKSKQARQGDKNLKVFYKADFEKVWQMYLPNKTAEPHPFLTE